MGRYAHAMYILRSYFANIFRMLSQLAKRADIGQKRISSLVRYLPSAVRMSVSSRLLPPSILLRTKTIPFCPTIGTEFVRYLPLILFCPTSGTEFVRYLPSFVLLSVSARLLPPSILRRTILFCLTSGTEFFRKNPPCHNLSLKFCIPALYIQTNPVDRDLRLSHGISQLRT